MQQTVLITGGTGLIGRSLTRLLREKGYAITILTRNPGQKKANGIRYAFWDIHSKKIDVEAVCSADHIIHLAGAGVMDKRWTKAYKQEIVESRTRGSELLIQTITTNPNNIRSIVSASAIGWYGPDREPAEPFIESNKAADDFLGQTCKLWEESISLPASTNIRVCKLRTGIVLSAEGGALEEFKKPVRFGIAAILGSGKQIISWIHMDDLCRLYLFAIENDGMNGSYNAVSDMPASNKQLTITLAEKMRGKFVIPIHIPGMVLKAVLGQSSIEVLKSATVSNKKIREQGFAFTYPSINAALTNLLK